MSLPAGIYKSVSHRSTLNLRVLYRPLLALCITSLLGCGGGGGGGGNAEGSAPPPGAKMAVRVGGLAPSSQVTLKNSLGETLTISDNGQFSFNKAIPYGGSYSLSVDRQPQGQICSVAAGSGTGAGVTAESVLVDLRCADTAFRIGGTVTGLPAGASIALRNNASDSITLRADGAFSFPGLVALNGGYAVTIAEQPADLTCSTGASHGWVSAEVTSVTVTCSIRTHAIGGRLHGLPSGSQLTLLLNGDQPLTLKADGDFTFPGRVAHNGSYSVTVSSQPKGMTCSVGNGSGAGVTHDSLAIRVVCAYPSSSVSFTVAGLAAGQSLVLVKNGFDQAWIQSNGHYSFSEPVPFNGDYSIVISTQPFGQTCTVRNGSRTGVTAPITDVEIVCSTISYPIGGTLTGLATGKQVTLLNNGADPLILTTNGRFAFRTPTAHGGSYLITVGTQPESHVCTVRSGSGSPVHSDIDNISVECARSSFQIGGTVSGLAPGQQLNLLNNGADALIVQSNGNFRFPGQVAARGPYAVTVGTHPASQICTVSQGNASSTLEDIGNIQVICRAGFSVGGTVSGLGSLSGLVISNGADTVTVPPHASTFTLPTRVATGAPFNLAVRTQPSSGTDGMTSTISCTLQGGTGTMGNNAINTANVICSGTLVFSKPGVISWKVPHGISQLSQLSVTGGGGDGPSTLGGSGATISASTISVSGYSELTLEVGAGGTNLAGGDASAVTPVGAALPLIVAGGGGSGGRSSGFGSAGAGGHADIGTGTGRFGQIGVIGLSPNESTVRGGDGGGGGVGGAGGLGFFGGSGGHGATGSNGAIAKGGGGAQYGAGGGGGGYGGGGGGGSGYNGFGGGSSAGAGGGGGGSLIPAGASASLANNGGSYTRGSDGAITIQY